MWRIRNYQVACMRAGRQRRTLTQLWIHPTPGRAPNIVRTQNQRIINIYYFSLLQKIPLGVLLLDKTNRFSVKSHTSERFLVLLQDSHKIAKKTNCNVQWRGIAIRSSHPAAKQPSEHGLRVVLGSGTDHLEKIQCFRHIVLAV